MRYTIIVLFIIISFCIYLEYKRLNQAKEVDEFCKARIMEIRKDGLLSQRVMDLKIREEKENPKEDSLNIIKAWERNKIELKSMHEKMIFDINNDRDREIDEILKYNIILKKLN